jgi:tetratricopeptide (TPR) repeat protein
MAHTAVAHALTQQGVYDDAEGLFQEAERRQALFQPDFPILYSTTGYQYCDLLLARGQREEVLRRVSQWLAWSKVYRGFTLLDTALIDLVSGRACPPGSIAAAHLDQAVTRLRQAGRSDYLPLALLERAALYRQDREFEKAQRDLQEALVHVNRSSMRLRLADLHLEQIRLLLVQDRKDDARPHFETVSALIGEIGYHRRDPALAEFASQFD